MSQTVLVCGGRDYADWKSLHKVLDAAHYANPIAMLIAGGARGADMLAVAWADSRLIPKKVFRADWKRHGKAAGPLRNQHMLTEGDPDLVIAFPGGPGTADMVKRAENAGVPVVKITKAVEASDPSATPARRNVIVSEANDPPAPPAGQEGGK